MFIKKIFRTIVFPLLILFIFCISVFLYALPAKALTQKPEGFSCTIGAPCTDYTFRDGSTYCLNECVDWAVNYCCGSDVCNDLVQGNCGYSWNGGDSPVCGYNPAVCTTYPSNITHIDACACGCSGGSCNTCPQVDSASLTCDSSPRTLHASWSGNSSNSCNIYINNGTDHQISTACNGSWDGSTIPNGGGTVPAGGSFILYVSDGTNTRSSSYTCPGAPTSTCDGCTYVDPNCTTSGGDLGIQVCDGKRGSDNVCRYDNGCTPNCDPCEARYSCSGISCISDHYGTFTSCAAANCNPSCSYGTWGAWYNTSCCGTGLMGERHDRTVISGSGCTGTSETRCTKTDSSCNTATPPPGLCGGVGQRPCCNGGVSLRVSPNTVNVGTNMAFTISGSASTYVNDTRPGVNNCSGDWNSQTCTAQTAGSNYTWTHNWRNCVGGFDINTQCSDICSATTTYTINSPTSVTLKPTISCNSPITSPNDRFLISWASISPAVTWVDISPTNDFTNNFYNENITGGKTSTTAPGGFCRNPYNLPCNNTKSPLNFLFQSQTFKVRLFNGAAHTQPVDYGTINTTDCPYNSTSVTGVCSATHYNCNAGTSVNKVAGATQWTWRCNGSGGGSNASCNQAMPPPPAPTNLTATCPVPGTAAHINWTDVPGANFYLLTVNNTTLPVISPPFPNPATGTLPGYKTYFNTAAGNSYYWKLQSCWWTFTGIGYACSGYSAEPTVTCGNPLTATCTGAANGLAITWTAVPSGGSLSYTYYAWSGNDSFSSGGILASTSKIYSTSGLKTAHVTVTSSDGQTATSLDCSATTTIYTPWIQVTGDVHSNTGINATGGP